MQGSIWITANAGSGKTTFLTRRVVRLLLAGVQPERICCITYTKAAASEMRHRVLAMLRSLLLAEDAACTAQLAQLLERAPTAEEITRARSLFGMVLDSVSGGLQLTTIHGFCQNILRRFPLEADIAPHFNVLEDEAATKLLMRAKHRLLGEYASGDPLLDAAFGMIGLRSNESRFDDYVQAIIQKRGMWEAVWRGQSPELFRTRLFALHGLAPDTNDAALRAALCGCVTHEEAAVIRSFLPQLQNHANKGEQHIGQILARWLESDAAQREVLITEFCLLFLTKEGAPRKQLLSKKDFPEGSPLYGVMGRLAMDVARFSQQVAALAAAEESYVMAILARALLMQYEQAKLAIHALDYEDLIGKVRALFANPSMLGWVMSKLDHRIDHLLIDEAQDTSGEQWSMAQLLIEELIATNQGVGSGNIPRSLLVVGDEKQSIYSFQGAAPELFATKKAEFHQMLDGSPAPLEEAQLTTSYRSAEAVLTLVDHIAARPEIARALNAQGVMHPHGLKRTEAAGRVVLYPPLLAPETAAQPPLTLPLEYQLAQSAPRLLAEQIADTVAAWLAEGRLLESEGRALTAGDILILVRTRATLVLSLIRAFERRGIPVAGLDRLTLAEHLAVRDVLALIQWVLNPADDLALAQVLRSPLVGISDEALRALCVARPGSLWAAVEDTDHGATLSQWLLKRSLTPYEFLTEVLEVSATRTCFAARFGEEVHEVLDEVKQQAAAMPPEMLPSLAYFYDWLHGSARQIKREQESGAAGLVRIMTVHGAKGLEAPVVILADTVSMPTTQQEMLYFVTDAHGQRFPVLAISDDAKAAPRLTQAKQAKKDALLAEYYRLFYVALTRARDELHLWGTASKKGSMPEACWYALAQQAMQQLHAAEEDGALVLRDVRAPVRKVEKEHRQFEKPALPAWAKRRATAPSVLLRSVSPSQLAPQVTVSAYAASGGADSRARGVKIHRVLELLRPDSQASDIARLVALVGGEWSTGEQQKAVAEITALYQKEIWIWQNPSHAEAAVSGMVAMHGVALPMNGQIDRIVETPEAIVILDYKTGRHVPRTAEDVSENYRVQLKVYQALLQQIYPHKPVRCAIVWTAAPLLMWCDAAVATTRWPEVQPSA